MQGKLLRLVMLTAMHVFIMSIYSVYFVYFAVSRLCNVKQGNLFLDKNWKKEYGHCSYWDGSYSTLHDVQSRCIKIENDGCLKIVDLFCDNTHFGVCYTYTITNEITNGKPDCLYTKPGNFPNYHILCIFIIIIFLSQCHVHGIIFILFHLKEALQNVQYYFAEHPCQIHSTPCMNEGICNYFGSNGEYDYSCMCPITYEGEQCERGKYQ